MHIYLFVYLLVFQSFFSCQKSQEKARPLASNLVYQSVDGGKTWKDVSAGLPSDLQVGTVYTSESEVLLGSNNSLYRSSTSPAPPKWEQEVFPAEKITQIVPGLRGPIVCTYGNGFFQKIQGTSTWRPLQNTLKDRNIYSVLETDENTFFVGCDSGIYKSSDGGKTWNHVYEGGWINKLVMNDGVLMGVGYWYLVRSIDGGKKWNQVLKTESYIHDIGVFEDQFVTLLDRDNPNKLFISADKGQTWQKSEENGNTQQFLFGAKKVGEYQFSSQEEGIFRSIDQGKTWDLVLPSPGQQGRPWEVYLNSTRNKKFTLAVSGKVIFAAVILEGC